MCTYLINGSLTEGCNDQIKRQKMEVIYGSLTEGYNDQIKMQKMEVTLQIQRNLFLNKIYFNVLKMYKCSIFSKNIHAIPLKILVSVLLINQGEMAQSFMAKMQ